MAILKKKTEKQEAQQLETKADAASVVYNTSAQRTLVAPRISEKSSKLAGANKYVFNVALKANKIEVKKAVEDAYKVKVVQVNIITGKGKTRNYGRTHGRTSAFKKAIVTLKSGEVIKGAMEKI